MEVVVYTRHSKGCPHESDRYSRKCRCRKWFDYSIDGRQVRESAKTRSWETAVKLARQKEREHEDRRLGVAPAPKTTAVMIEDAVATYIKKISDPKAGRKEQSLVKPKRMTSLLLEFCDRKNLTYLSELTPLILEEWRSGWTYRPGSHSLRIHDHHIRAFFKWAHRMELIPTDPYAKLDRFVVRNPAQTMPLSREEVTRLLAAIPLTDLSAEEKSYAHALMRLQRWSGLAITDAVTLQRDALSPDNSLELRRTKTGEAVVTALPADIADELRMHERTPSYFFWDTSVKRESAVNEALDWYRAIFDAAKVSRQTNGGLPLSHRFRDTFAVEFLLAGGSFEDLSNLLGNTVAICERHYSAWVPARRERLVQIARESIERQQAAERGVTIQ